VSHSQVMPASYYDPASRDLPMHWSQLPHRGLVLDRVAHWCLRSPVIDIGCGPGYLVQRLAERGVDVLGVDTSARAIAFARRVNPGQRLMVAHRSLLRRILQHVHHRTVVLLQVLEHVPDDLRFLSLIPQRRRVVLSVPSSQSVGHVRWFESLDEVETRYGALVRPVRMRESQHKANRWFLLDGVRR
jgi:2-polyprenyl-3-methyl-5-hydroxy-6-metoxy-1,4-benzoquinol methylase